MVVRHLLKLKENWYGLSTKHCDLFYTWKKYAQAQHYYSTVILILKAEKKRIIVVDM